MQKGIQPGSQGARILAALKDGNFVSVAEIHRRAGTSRLNSRVSDLRKHGYRIEHRYDPGRGRATLAHQYRLVDPPALLPSPETVAPPRHPLDRDATPRDLTRRFRVYVTDERNRLLLMATAASEEEVGVEVCKLGRSGEISRCCLGILDTHGIEKTDSTGDWIINPWDGKLI